MLQTFLVTLLGLIGAQALFAHTIETVGSYTHDSQFNRQDYNLSLSETIPLDELEQFVSTVSVSGGYSHVERVSNDSSFAEAWDYRSQIDERRGGISLNQDFYKRFGLSLSYQRRLSEISSGYSWGTSAYLWFLRETLRLTAAYNENDDRLQVIETIDKDVVRILTPSNVTGKVYSLEVMNLFTTTTILQANVSKIVRNDRPDAYSYAISGREYFPVIEGALHLNLGYFQNIGEIKPITLQGEVKGRSVQGEWHQRLFTSFIAMAGYRYYLEEEDPRAKTEPKKESGSDWMYARVTYRFWKDDWALPANEVYVFGGNYRNSTSIAANVWGAGVKLEL